MYQESSAAEGNRSVAEICAVLENDDAASAQRRRKNIKQQYRDISAQGRKSEAIKVIGELAAARITYRS